VTVVYLRAQGSLPPRYGRYTTHELKPRVVAFGSTQPYFPQNRAQELSAPVLRYSWTSPNLHLTYVARPWQSATTDTPTMEPVKAGYYKAHSNHWATASSMTSVIMGITGMDMRKGSTNRKRSMTLQAGFLSRLWQRRVLLPVHCLTKFKGLRFTQAYLELTRSSTSITAKSRCVPSPSTSAPPGLSMALMQPLLLEQVFC
jgi:hypothetical protein